MKLKWTTEQILNFDYDDIKELDKSEVSKLVQRLSDTATKRLQYMKKSVIYDTTNLEKNFPDLSTRGKTKKQLLSTFQKAKSLLEKKTASASGRREQASYFKKALAEKLGTKRARTLTKNPLFWDAYNKLVEEHALLKQYRYDVTEIIEKELETKGTFTKSVDDVIREVLGEGYQEYLKALETPTFGKFSGGENMGGNYEDDYFDAIPYSRFKIRKY